VTFRKHSVVFVGILILCFSTPLLSQDAKLIEAGKKAFVANKCNMCHAVAAEGIEKTMKTSATAKVVPPDLSGIGAKHNADTLTKYIKKEVDLNGKKHTKGWTGKEEDLKSIAAWLESLKKPSETK
jgi:hypothetical protein